jgi:hypothetical protein
VSDFAEVAQAPAMQMLHGHRAQRHVRLHDESVAYPAARDQPDGSWLRIIDQPEVPQS